MIIDNSDELYNNIMNALAKVTNTSAWSNIDNSTGKITSTEDLFPFDVEDLNDKYSRMGIDTNVRKSNFNGKGVPSKPVFQTEYDNTLFTGTEAMFQIVSKEVLNYIIDNVEVAMKERMDALENDYNNLLIAIHKAASDIGSVTTSAVTNIRYELATSGNYVPNLLYDSINVIEPSVLSDIVNDIPLSAGGIDRYNTITKPMIDENEIITIDGVDYDVQIK